jgi:hypothetical protein
MVHAARSGIQLARKLVQAPHLGLNLMRRTTSCEMAMRARL